MDVNAADLTQPLRGMAPEEDRNSSLLKSFKYSRAQMCWQTVLRMPIFEAVR